MKFIVGVENKSGVCFDNVTDFMVELLTMVKASMESGGTYFEVEASTDAGKFVLNGGEGSVERKDYAVCWYAG